MLKRNRHELHAFLELLETAAHAAVDDGVADLGDDAAEDGRIDGDLDGDLLAGLLAECGGETLPSDRRRAATAERTSATASARESAAFATKASMMAGSSRPRPAPTTKLTSDVVTG